MRDCEAKQTFRSFEGSLHSIDAPDATIRDVAERTTLTVYFNTTLTQSGSTYVYPNFPETSNILYEADGNKMKRIVNQRVYSTANDVIYSVSEAGFVTRIK